MPALPASAYCGSPPEPIEIIMAAKRPDFDRQWAEPDIAQNHVVVDAGPLSFEPLDRAGG
jgi:hypothetical protein